MNISFDDHRIYRCNSSFYDMELDSTVNLCEHNKIDALVHKFYCTVHQRYTEGDHVIYEDDLD